MGGMSNSRSLPNATAPGVGLQHSLAGSPVQGSGGVTHATGNIQPVTGLSAPYVPPKRRQKDNMKQLCSSEGCKAYPMKTVPYCAGHAKSLGLAKWDNTPKALRKDSHDDTGSAEATGPAADGDN